MSLATVPPSASPGGDSRPLRVLVVNQYFPPDTSATAGVFRDLVAALGAAGHGVTVLCGRPSYAPQERRPWRPLQREASAGATVERVGSTAFARRRMSGRVSNYLTYLALAGARALLGARPDVAVAGSDPPLAVWVALLAARGRPVVYSLQDLHPDVALAAGALRPGRLARLWDAAHSAALRRCALVACLDPTMAQRVRAKGVSAGRVAVVANGAARPTGAPDPALVGDLRAGAAFVVVHGGNLGAAGAWDTLVQATARCGDGCAFVFVGDGARAGALRAAGARVVPFLPPDQLASVMAAGDLQVVTLREGMDGGVMPSKLYTVLAHGRPVLAVAPRDSELARLVLDRGCGLVADPDAPQEVADAVAWARARPAELAAMAARARAAARDFDRGAQMRRLAALAERAARGTAAVPPGAVPAARAAGTAVPAGHQPPAQRQDLG